MVSQQISRQEEDARLSRRHGGAAGPLAQMLQTSVMPSEMTWFTEHSAQKHPMGSRPAWLCVEAFMDVVCWYIAVDGAEMSFHLDGRRAGISPCSVRRGCRSGTAPAFCEGSRTVRGQRARGALARGEWRTECSGAMWMTRMRRRRRRFYDGQRRAQAVAACII